MGSTRKAKFATRCLILLLIIAGTSGCLAAMAPPARTPAEHCGISNEELVADADANVITLWARAYGEGCWRAFMPVVAVREDDVLTVAARAIEMQANAYLPFVNDAAASGNAPDIVHLSDAEWIPLWADAGYIVPLDECIEKHSAFEMIQERVWERYRWRDQTWAIPFETRATVLFYSKPRLKELGWSPQQIDELPESIKNGAFTLTDLLETSKQAARIGIVRPGFGLRSELGQFAWFRLFYTALGGQLDASSRDRLVLDPKVLARTYELFYQIERDRILIKTETAGTISRWGAGIVLNDAEAHGHILFWLTQNSHWTTLLYDHAVYLGGEQFMEKNIGYALFPTNQPNQGGFTWWHSTNFYAIVSEDASGRSNQNKACDILAKSLSADGFSANIVKSGTFSVLESPELFLPNEPGRFYYESQYMTDYIRYLPSFSSYQRVLIETIVSYIEQVVSGNLLPEDAATLTIRDLRDQLGDSVYIDDPGQ